VVKDIYAQLDLNQSEAYRRVLEQVQLNQQNRDRGYGYERQQYEGF